jgi:hypothetical protein
VRLSVTSRSPDASAQRFAGHRTALAGAPSDPATLSGRQTRK